MSELCPRCGATMKERKEPLRIRGIYVGSYDSMSCPVCKYYYFTDKEYDLAVSNAQSLGLIGPSIPEISLVITSERLNIDSILRFDKTANPTAKLKKGKKGQATFELEEVPSVTNDHIVFQPNNDHERLALITLETGT